MASLLNAKFYTSIYKDSRVVAFVHTTFYIFGSTYSYLLQTDKEVNDPSDGKLLPIKDGYGFKSYMQNIQLKSSDRSGWGNGICLGTVL